MIALGLGPILLGLAIAVLCAAFVAAEVAGKSLVGLIETTWYSLRHPGRTAHHA